MPRWPQLSRLGARPSTYHASVMERSIPHRNRMGTAAYWGVAVLLVGFGFLGLFSIGAPFLLTGTAMMVVSPWRNRREVLWPTLVGVWVFVLGYVLVAPLSCYTSSSMDPITVNRTRFFGHVLDLVDHAATPAVAAR